MELELSPQVFGILSGLFEEKLGIRYEVQDRELMASKLRDLVDERGFDSFLDYYYFLRYDDAGPAAIEQAIEALVVAETYFFRELEPLRRTISHVIEPRVREHGSARIWCAASATGEEPLTISMLLHHTKLAGQVELVASDISKKSLDRAARGAFNARALRDPPPDDLARFIEKTETGVSIPSAIRDTVNWKRVNLVSREEVQALGIFDVIFCRNVLIYFSDVMTRTVVESLSQQLRAGGALLVGVAESLMRFGVSLRCEERSGVFIYTKDREAQ